MSRRKSIGVVLSAVMVALLLVPTGAGASQSRTYSITIYNLTDGQPLTPPAAATHRRSVELFDVGSAASLGLQEIAENGNLGPMLDFLATNRRVGDFVAAGAPNPILPGGDVTFELSASRGTKRFSFVSMLVCSNDGFTGLDSIRLPKKVGDSGEWYAEAYDAGTEANTEHLGDIVPPCSGGATGVGTSNPNLATNGVVAPHAGILGTGTCDLILDPATHGWDGAIAKVVITRTG